MSRADIFLAAAIVFMLVGAGFETYAMEPLSKTCGCISAGLFIYWVLM